MRIAEPAEAKHHPLHLLPAMMVTVWGSCTTGYRNGQAQGCALVGSSCGSGQRAHGLVVARVVARVGGSCASAARPAISGMTVAAENTIDQTNRQIEFPKIDLGDVACEGVQQCEVLKNTNTAQTIFCRFPAPPCLCYSNNVCKSRLWHSQFILRHSALYFVFLAQTFWNPVGAVSSPCALRRQYSKRKVVVCPYHIPTLCTSDTPWCCEDRTTYTLAQVVSPSASTNSMNRRDFLVRSGQATPISQGGIGTQRTRSHGKRRA